MGSKLISTKMHGVLDYLTVGMMLGLPRMLGCKRSFTDAVTCLALGKLAYALFTRHELGAVKVIPMKTHLALDTAGGATLAALPFLMDEDDPAARTACVALGIFDIAAAPLTETRSVPAIGADARRVAAAVRQAPAESLGRFAPGAGGGAGQQQVQTAGR